MCLELAACWTNSIKVKRNHRKLKTQFFKSHGNCICHCTRPHIREYFDLHNHWCEHSGLAEFWVVVNLSFDCACLELLIYRYYVNLDRTWHPQNTFLLEYCHGQVCNPVFCLKYTESMGVGGGGKWVEPPQSHVMYLILILIDSKSDTKQFFS